MGICAHVVLAERKHSEDDRAMKTLKEQLLTPEKRPAIVRDSVRLIEDEVASKSGMSGFAIKAAFKVVKALRPGMIQDSVEGLLDDFVTQLEPFYSAHHESDGKSFSTYISGRKSEIANALLATTDERARVTRNSTLKKAYNKLRPKGVEQVIVALPRVGRMLDSHGV